MTEDPVDRILAEFEQSLDARPPQGRDELLARREEVIARHSEQRDALREYFADMDAVAGVVQPSASDADPLPQPAGPDPVGGERLEYLGDYQILERLDHGGMGIVYRARQLTLNRIVAVKLIRRDQPATARERFRREALTMAGLEHPHIVGIHEVQEHQGWPYLAMEYLPGGSLAARLKHGPLPPREAAELMRKIADAVYFAHERGVLHRDLKPANILLDADNEPHVSDFGLALPLNESVELTRTGQTAGTPAYMAPEQLQGDRRAVSVRSDVFSLGVILYQLLTGEIPFTGTNPFEIQRRIVSEEPRSPRKLSRAVSADLAAVCLRCLEKDPQRRLSSAGELRDCLDAYLQGRPVPIRPIRAWERVRHWCRRNPIVTGLGVALFITSLVAGWSSWSATQFAEQSRQDAIRSAGLAREADRRARIAKLESVAELSVEFRHSNPELGALLVAEATEKLQAFAAPVPTKVHQWLREAIEACAGHPLEADAFSFSSDGRWLVTSQQRKIRVWDLRSEDPFARPRWVWNIPKHQGDFWSESHIRPRLHFSERGDWLLVETARLSLLWSLTDTESAGESIIVPGLGLAIAPDSSECAAVRDNKTVISYRLDPPKRVPLDAVEKKRFETPPQNLLTLSPARQFEIPPKPEKYIQLDTPGSFGVRYSACGDFQFVVTFGQYDRGGWSVWAVVQRKQESGPVPAWSLSPHYWMKDDIELSSDRRRLLIQGKEGTATIYPLDENAFLKEGVPIERRHYYGIGRQPLFDRRVADALDLRVSADDGTSVWEFEISPELWLGSIGKTAPAPSVVKTPATPVPSPTPPTEPAEPTGQGQRVGSRAPKDISPQALRDMFARYVGPEFQVERNERGYLQLEHSGKRSRLPLWSDVIEPKDARSQQTVLGWLLCGNSLYMLRRERDLDLRFTVSFDGLLQPPPIYYGMDEVYAAFSSNLRWLALNDKHGVHLLDLKAEKLWPLRMTIPRQSAVEFSPDCRYLVTRARGLFRLFRVPADHEDELYRLPLVSESPTTIRLDRQQYVDLREPLDDNREGWMRRPQNAPASHPPCETVYQVRRPGNTLEIRSPWRENVPDAALQAKIANRQRPEVSKTNFFVEHQSIESADGSWRLGLGHRGISRHRLTKDAQVDERSWDFPNFEVVPPHDYDPVSLSLEPGETWAVAHGHRFGGFLVDLRSSKRAVQIAKHRELAACVVAPNGQVVGVEETQGAGEKILQRRVHSWDVTRVNNDLKISKNPAFELGGAADASPSAKPAFEWSEFGGVLCILETSPLRKPPAGKESGDGRQEISINLVGLTERYTLTGTCPFDPLNGNNSNRVRFVLLKDNKCRILCSISNRLLQADFALGDDQLRFRERAVTDNELKSKIHTGTGRFSPNGRWYAVGSCDEWGQNRSTWIWDLDQTESWPLQVSQNQLPLDFSQDSRRLVLGARGTPPTLISLDFGQLIGFARRFAGRELTTAERVMFGLDTLNEAGALSADSPKGSVADSTREN